jgi:hypothetical protein
LRLGLSRNIQPENTLACCAALRSRISIWTKAPVCCGISQGAVRSHAETRMITGPISRASPGFNRISSETLLRLLSRPSTATRSFMGVAP